MNYARTNLTTNSLEILASYRKREVLKEVLDTLMAIKNLVSRVTNLQFKIYPNLSFTPAHDGRGTAKAFGG